MWDAVCTEPGCAKFASHGTGVGARRTHCAEHGAPLGLVDVKHRICLADGCATVATYGVPEAEAAAAAAAIGAVAAPLEVVATHCSLHGTPLGLVDVQNPRCSTSGCNVRWVDECGMAGPHVSWTCAAATGTCACIKRRVCSRQ